VNALSRQAQYLMQNKISILEPCQYLCRVGDTDSVRQGGGMVAEGEIVWLSGCVEAIVLRRSLVNLISRRSSTSAVNIQTWEQKLCYDMKQGFSMSRS
jgi:hypothetical protein